VTYPISPVVNAPGGDTFGSLYDKVNTALWVISSFAVTANGTANGSLTTGNAYVNGIFSALTLATPTLRGGNVQSSANLVVSSNVSVGNSTANVFIGNGAVVAGAVQVN